MTRRFLPLASPLSGAVAIAAITAALLAPVPHADAGPGPASDVRAPGVRASAHETPAVERARGPVVTVLQANINGAKFRGDAKVTPLRRLRTQIEATRPDVVLIQELCDDQKEVMQRWYGTRKWAFTRYFVADEGSAREPGTRGRGCDTRTTKKTDGVWKNNATSRKKAQDGWYAVLDPSQRVDDAALATSARVVQLPTITDKPWYRYPLLCATVPVAATSVVACSTKLAAAAGTGTVDVNVGVRNRQGRALDRAVTSPALRGRHLIVGGDMNTRPGARALDPLYRTSRSGATSDPRGARGVLWEADETDRTFFTPRHLSDGVRCQADTGHCRTGQFTHYNDNTQRAIVKLDYVFFRWDRFAGDSLSLRPVAGPSSGTKHAYLLAHARLIS